MRLLRDEEGQGLVVVLALVGLVSATAVGYAALVSTAARQATLRAALLADARASDAGATYALWYATSKGLPPGGALAVPDAGDGQGGPTVTITDLRPGLQFGPLHAGHSTATYDSPAHEFGGAGDVFLTVTWTTDVAGSGTLGIRYDTSPTQPAGFANQATLSMAAGETLRTDTVSLPAGSSGIHYLHLQNSTTGGVTIAFRGASSTWDDATSVTVARPAAVASGDVMVAEIAFEGGTEITITPPAGWTLLRRTDQTTDLGLAVYWRAAGASEPASYTWSFSDQVESAAGILAYGGVDAASPVDVHDGQATPNGTDHATPSVTTTVANTLIVAAHAVKKDSSWTPPAGMSERYDVAGPGKVTLAGSDASQAAAGATGAKTAISAVPEVGVALILALRPGTADVHLASADANGASAGQFHLSYPGMAFQAISARGARTTALDASVTRSGGAYSVVVNSWTLR